MKRNIGVTLAIIFFLLFIAYGGFETIKVVAGPSLSVSEPKDLDTVYDPLVEVKGQVARAAYITVDGRQVFADTKGDFSTELLLPPGYSIISVSVKDRFGKEVVKDLTLSYLPSATATPVIIENTATSTATTTSTTTSSN